MSTQCCHARRVFSSAASTTTVSSYLVMMGNADNGRVGSGSGACTVGDRDSRALPTQVPFEHGVRQVSCGGAHTVVVDTTGTVFAFGLNDEGQCGQALDVQSVWDAGEVLVPEEVGRVAAGHRHSLAIGKEHVWRWGGGSELPRVLPLPEGGKAIDVVAGDGYSIVVTSGGQALLFGDGQTGSKYVALCPGRKIVRAAAGHFHAALVDEDGTVLLVPHVHAQSVTAVEQNTHIVHPARDIACGGGHTLVALEGGGVMSWGPGEALGLGDGEGRKVPTRIRRFDGAEIVKVAAGWKHSAAIDRAGRLFTWGWGGSQGGSISLIESRGSGGGQLGLGDDCDAWEPRAVDTVRMGALEIPNEYWKAVDVSLGINHSAAIIEAA